MASAPSIALASYGKRGPATFEIILSSVVLAAVFAICGRAFLNRVSAFLLGAVGGTIGAGMWHNVTGAAIGFIVGSVIALSPPYRRSIAKASTDT